MMKPVNLTPISTLRVVATSPWTKRPPISIEKHFMLPHILYASYAFLLCTARTFITGLCASSILAYLHTLPVAHPILYYSLQY
jgi:hypothetical protein